MKPLSERAKEYCDSQRELEKNSRMGVAPRYHYINGTTETLTLLMQEVEKHKRIVVINTPSTMIEIDDLKAIVEKMK